MCNKYRLPDPTGLIVPLQSSFDAVPKKSRHSNKGIPQEFIRININRRRRIKRFLNRIEQNGYVRQIKRIDTYPCSPLVGATICIKQFVPGNAQTPDAVTAEIYIEDLRIGRCTLILSKIIPLKYSAVKKIEDNIPSLIETVNKCSDIGMYDNL
jgi:hypothetical protein